MTQHTAKVMSDRGLLTQTALIKATVLLVGFVPLNHGRRSRQHSSPERWRFML
jgi:hypothetical protein